MTFVHEDPDFPGLLRIVAAKEKLAESVIEKDYWVTHALWVLHDLGLEVWFKGGTSLSKGFGLIQRFSEDLDLKIDSGQCADVPPVPNSAWNRKSKSKPNERERESNFRAICKVLEARGLAATLHAIGNDTHWRECEIRVAYPLTHGAPPRAMKPYVSLEIGDARVKPSVERDLSSFVHSHLDSIGELAAFDSNQPTRVRCLHPLVTLLEKLDNLQVYAPAGKRAAPRFVRHFEDAAQIIRAAPTLPPLVGYADVRAIAEEMLAEGQICALPHSGHEAFALTPGERTSEIASAHQEIASMFWGERIQLEDASAMIREWVAIHFA